MNREQTAKLRAFVVAKAQAYATNAAGYDDTCFTTNGAAAYVGEPPKSLPVYQALEDLEREGIVQWYWGGSLPGYWRPTEKAAREVAS